MPLAEGRGGERVVARYKPHLRFLGGIERGEILQTIHHRTPLQPPLKAGELLQLCSGIFAINLRVLMTGRCTKIEPISIVRLKGSLESTVMVTVGGEYVYSTSRDTLAIASGFADWADMLEFYSDLLPFYGTIIHWVPAPKGGA